MFDNIDDDELETFPAIFDEVEAHWERMIQCAKHQPKNAPCTEHIMRSEIGEDWHDIFCELCKICIDIEEDCPNCPLSQVYGFCAPINRSNKWGRVMLSKNWDEWTHHAAEFLAQIREVHEMIKTEILRREFLLYGGSEDMNEEITIKKLTIAPYFEDE